MQFVEDEIDMGIDYIPEKDGRAYIRAPIDFSLDLFAIIQSDPATWGLEAFSLISFTVIPFIMLALMGLIMYDAWLNPAVTALFMKNLVIFRDLIISKLPSSISGMLPAMLTGN